HNGLCVDYRRSVPIFLVVELAALPPVRRPEKASGRAQPFLTYPCEPPSGRCGGARVPSGCPLHTSPAKVLVVCAEISSTGRQMLLSPGRLWSEVYVSGESPQSAGGRAPRRSCIPVSSALPRAPASSRAYGARRAVPDRPPRENRRANRDTIARNLPPRRR